jgi:hypothetical protein
LRCASCVATPGGSRRISFTRTVQPERAEEASVLPTSNHPAAPRAAAWPTSAMRLVSRISAGSPEGGTRTAVGHGVHSDPRETGAVRDPRHALGLVPGVSAGRIRVAIWPGGVVTGAIAAAPSVERRDELHLRGCPDYRSRRRPCRQPACAPGSLHHSRRAVIPPVLGGEPISTSPEHFRHGAKWVGAKMATRQLTRRREDHFISWSHCMTS